MHKMSLENADENLLNQSTNHEMQRKLKISYTREFLLSLSELDICKELPSGFDRSILSEFDDACQDRQRSTGGLSMHSFRRNEYGSSPPTRGDVNSFSRGVHGKWETRTSGRSDIDNDSRSEWDLDSGKCFGNQSRRSWQGPEHDGLLGSGSFPRPSGFSSGLSGSKFQSNGNNQQNRSNEPYQPPRPYKAPHSRRDTDSYNDETFGSLECTSEDRVEEERKRRASFELMRKEQQKAFQEKQKLNPERNKGDFDITSLLDEDERRLINRSSESMEPPATVMSSSNDSEKSSFLAQTFSATRPLVPPGFTSAIFERNLVAKKPVHTHSTEVGQPDLGDAQDNHISLNSENKEELLTAKHADVDQHHHQSTSLNVLNNNEKEKNLDLSSIVDVPDIKIRMDDPLGKKSALLKALKASDDSEVIQLNAKVEGKENVGPFNQHSSNSILEKLFGNALTSNSGSSSSAVKPDHKADETWSPQACQSSKFAHWFIEEGQEKKPAVDDFIHRPNDLLSLIVGGEKGGLQVPDVNITRHNAPDIPFQICEPAGGHMTADIAYTTISNSEQPYKSDKPEIPAVLTCEDLEQTILSQVNENGSSLQLPSQDKEFNAKSEESNSNVDNQASIHLLSLLQKRTFHKDTEPSIQDVDSINKVHNTEGVTTGDKVDNPVEANTEVSNSLKTLTLETLFGTAFMEELQSVGAPLSVQTGSVGSAGADFSESSLFPFADNGQSAVELALNKHGSGVLPLEKTHEPKLNRFVEQWLASDNCQGDIDSSKHQSELSKSGGYNGRTGIHRPEEESWVADGDPLQNLVSASNSAKAELSEDTPVDIVGKLAALDPALRDERRIVANQEGLAYPCGPYDMREPGFSHQNLNVRRSSPQLHTPHLNHMGQMFNQLDSGPPHISYIKQLAPEGIIHHDSMPNQFPGNMVRPPYHQPSTERPGFDSPAHQSMLQQMHLQGNLPPPHLVQGFSRGSPLPAHPSNPMANLMQEPNPMQGFPFSGHQQPTFGGPGIPLPAPDVAGGRNHPEALQRLFEMELRSNSKMVHPLAAGGHSQGTYGQPLDLGFGYR